MSNDLETRAVRAETIRIILAEACRRIGDDQRASMIEHGRAVGIGLRAAEIAVEMALDATRIGSEVEVRNAKH